MQRYEEAFAVEFSQRLSPIATNIQSFRADVGDQRRQVRLEIVATTLLKLFEKIRRPILAVHFKTVAENCVRTIGLKRFHQTIADVLQIMVGRRRVEMIEY